MLGSASSIARAALGVAMVVATVIAPLDAAHADKAPKDLQRTIGVGTAGPDGLDGRTSYVYALKPGQTVRDRVAILNYTLRPLPVRLYAADGFTTDAGAFDVLAAGQKSDSVGRWTSLKPQTVRIPGRADESVPPAERLVPFTLKVPRKAPPGDYIGAVVVSIPTPSAEPGNLVVDRRLAMPITVRVVGEVTPRAEVDIVSAEQTGRWQSLIGGTTRITYTITNSGTTVWDGDSTLSVAGPLGLFERSRNDARIERLLPGETLTRVVEVSGVPSLIRPVATVDLAPAPGAADPFSPVSDSQAFWAVPWWWLLIVAGLALLYRVVRRGRRGPGALVDSPADVHANEEVSA